MRVRSLQKHPVTAWQPLAATPQATETAAKAGPAQPLPTWKSDARASQPVGVTFDFEPPHRGSREWTPVPAFRITTEISAPPEACFDIARDIGFHTQSLAHTGERAVAGRTTGLIELGESVTWEAAHLRVRQQLTVEITAFDRPTHFQDTMTRGAFRSFVHDHHFHRRARMTVMTDHIQFQSPLGPLGWLVDRLVLTRHLRRLLEHRCQAIKHEAERRWRP